jgi:hypothetical protein
MSTSRVYIPPYLKVKLLRLKQDLNYSWRNRFWSRVGTGAFEDNLSAGLSPNAVDGYLTSVN